MVDLAGYLKAPERMVWMDIQLGPSGSPRPDVYTLNKSYVRPCPTAYECKISRSDFLSDVTSGKWSSYLQYAHSVVFAVPAGLVSKAEIPEQCGLIERKENVWRMAKRAVINPRRIDEEALLKLLIDGVRREGPAARAKRWESNAFAAKFGWTAARYVADAVSIERELKRAEENKRDIIDRAHKAAAEIRERAAQEAPKLWIELTELLALKPDADKWQIKRAMDEVRTAVAGGDAAIKLKAVLQTLRRLLQNHHAEELDG
jgi:hypothetical protein